MTVKLLQVITIFTPYAIILAVKEDVNCQFVIICNKFNTKISLIYVYTEISENIDETETKVYNIQKC